MSDTSPDRQELEKRYQRFSDAALVSSLKQPDISELERECLLAEIAARNTEAPAWATDNRKAPPETEDFVILERHFFNPIEAQILQGRLNAEGIPVLTTDAQTVQMYSLMGPALGGVSLRVPADRLNEAREVIKRVQRGEYAGLGEDEETTGGGADSNQSAMGSEAQRLQAFLHSERLARQWAAQPPHHSFNFGALIFGPAWCAFNKMYWLAMMCVLTIFASASALSVVTGGPFYARITIAEIISHIVLAFIGNRLHYEHASRTIAVLSRKTSDEERLLALLYKHGGFSLEAVLLYIAFAASVNVLRVLIS